MPDGYAETDLIVMSLFDREIYRDREARLRTEPVVMDFVAWSFFGSVWFDRAARLFRCAVSVHGHHSGTVSAETLDELMDRAAETYGGE